MLRPAFVTPPVMATFSVLFAPLAVAHMPADNIKAIKVNVQTTHDDKDLSWVVEITDGRTVFGKVGVGSGEFRENESSHDVDVNLDKSSPYADRESVKIKVTQKSSSKNWGWEGYLTVNGVMGDNSEKKLRGYPGSFVLSCNDLWNMQDGRWDRIPVDSAIGHPEHLP